MDSLENYADTAREVGVKSANSVKSAGSVKSVGGVRTENGAKSSGGESAGIDASGDKCNDRAANDGKDLIKYRLVTTTLVDIINSTGFTVVYS